MIMKFRYCFSYILTTIIFLMAMSQMTCAQSSQNKSVYIITNSDDTIRNCSIRKPHRLTNEDKVTYFYNNTSHSLPSNSIKSYFDGSQLFFSELLKNKNKHVLISYIIGGPGSFGQSISDKNEIIYYLKRSDTQEVVCLEEHKYSLLSFLHGFLPDFDTFIKTYDAIVVYDYKSIAELISAYNAFKEPNTFVPVKYQFKQEAKFGINASLGLGNLELENGNRYYINENNYSFGLNYKQLYSRNISLNFSLSFNNTSFIGTIEDLYIKAISFEPNLVFTANIFPRIDIALKGGINLNYNIDSYLNQKTEYGQQLDLSTINLGSQVGIEFTYLKRYSFFMHYLNYVIQTNESTRFSNNDYIKATVKSYQFGLIYYFKSVYFN